MKIINSLKFQFIVLFSLFIITVSVVTAILGVRELSNAVEESFASQGISIVERAAFYIDGDSFEKLAKSMDINDPFYEETRIKLLEIKEVSGCLYLYTMAPLNGDFEHNVWQFIIDGSVEPDDEENFSALGDEEDTSDYDDAFKTVVISGKTEPSSLVYQEGWGWLISIYTPIKNSAGKTVGIAGCDFDGTYLHDAIITGQKKKVIIGIVSIVTGLALLLLFLHMIFSRLKKINTILCEISLGEGDITKRIDVDKKDEIGELLTYFNMTLDKIRNLIIRIKGESNNLYATGNDLASNVKQTMESIFQIIENIEVIKQKISNQSSSASQSYGKMENVTVNINKLVKNVEIQTTSVSESSSAIEQMLANVQNVTQTLINNTGNVEGLIKVSNAGRSSLQKVSQDIQEITRESEGLSEINAVIENIASQTNLLSMNAAIEAAHAGESGKGFAVVAGEIRKLATNSTEQSKIISDVLRKIKTAIEAITASTSMVLQQFEAIDERVHLVSDQETNIRNAMEEQGQGSQQILEAVSRLNDQTQMVKNGSNEMLEDSKGVILESKNLEGITLEISGSMNKMAKDADEISISMNQVSEISRRTKEYIENLLSEVSKFKEA